MRAVIIGNGTITDYDYIKSIISDKDFIICADGGINHAEKMGLNVDILIGDFDSSSDKTTAAKTIQYPTRKDFTDGELCVEYAIDNGYDEILLIGMTGTRLDHTINNILLLLRFKNSCLINEHNTIYPITDSLHIDNQKGKTLSIIPLFSDLEGIVTEGLEYPLNDETLYFGQARGNSNVIISDACKITVKKGMGIVIINNGE